jgi:hypothetical protein
MTEPTYHDLSLPRLSWATTDAKTSTPPVTEGFLNFSSDAPAGMDMTNTSILNKRLEDNYNLMLGDPNADFSTKVSDPYGYGYASSLNEMRNQDAKEILMQESAMFTLGAIAGVSIIVAGLLFASSSDIVPPAPE